MELGLIEENVVDVLVILDFIGNFVKLVVLSFLESIYIIFGELGNMFF